MNLDEKSPPGWSGTVVAMKKRHGKEIDNPYALAWHMKDKGEKSHYKKAKGDDTTKQQPVPHHKAGEDKPKRKRHKKFSEWLEGRTSENLGDGAE